MQAHWERKKNELTEKPRKTRAATDDQRAKWREQKRHQDDKPTPQQKAQKKRRRNEKHRLRYKEKKLAALLSTTLNASESTQYAASMEVGEQCAGSQEQEMMQSINQSVFYFMSVHIEVILDNVTCRRGLPTAAG